MNFKLSHAICLVGFSCFMGIGRRNIYKGPFLSLSTVAPDDDFSLIAMLFILANHEIDFAQLA